MNIKSLLPQQSIFLFFLHTHEWINQCHLIKHWHLLHKCILWSNLSAQLVLQEPLWQETNVPLKGAPIVRRQWLSDAQWHHVTRSQTFPSCPEKRIRLIICHCQTDKNVSILLQSKSFLGWKYTAMHCTGCRICLSLSLSSHKRVVTQVSHHGYGALTAFPAATLTLVIW